MTRGVQINLGLVMQFLMYDCIKPIDIYKSLQVHPGTVVVLAAVIYILMV